MAMHHARHQRTPLPSQAAERHDGVVASRSLASFLLHLPHISSSFLSHADTQDEAHYTLEMLTPQMRDVVEGKVDGATCLLQAAVVAEATFDMLFQKTNSAQHPEHHERILLAHVAKHHG